MWACIPALLIWGYLTFFTSKKKEEKIVSMLENKFGLRNLQATDRKRVILPFTPGPNSRFGVKVSCQELHSDEVFYAKIVDRKDGEHSKIVLLPQEK